MPGEPHDCCGSGSSEIASYPTTNGFFKKSTDTGPVSALPDPTAGRSNAFNTGMINQYPPEVPPSSHVELTSGPSDSQKRKCSCLGCHWKPQFHCDDEKCKVSPNKLGDTIHYHCPEQCKTTLRRWGDLLRHSRAKHCENREKFPCPFPHCKRAGENGFPRKDKLKDHQNSVHRGDFMVSNRQGPPALRPAPFRALATAIGNLGIVNSSMGYD